MKAIYDITKGTWIIQELEGQQDTIRMDYW
jgi:hypothetical protein